MQDKKKRTHSHHHINTHSPTKTTHNNNTQQQQQQQHTTTTTTTTTHTTTTTTTTPRKASHLVVGRGAQQPVSSLPLWESWLVKPGASQGFCKYSETSPIIGSTLYGVAARRACPSSVTSFGRVTHAPADPRALCEATRRSLLHQLGACLCVVWCPAGVCVVRGAARDEHFSLSRAAPRSSKVGSRMVQGEGAERRAAFWCSSSV